MKMGINLAAKTLQRNIHELIQASACPAVVVRAVMEQELQAVREWEAQEVEQEKALLQKELEAEKETPAETPTASKKEA